MAGVRDEPVLIQGLDLRRQLLGRAAVVQPDVGGGAALGVIGLGDHAGPGLLLRQSAVGQPGQPQCTGASTTTTRW